jgi:hypothetical protein
MDPGPDAQVTINTADIIIFGDPSQSMAEQHPRANASIRVREHLPTIPVLESPATIQALIHQAVAYPIYEVGSGSIDLSNIEPKPGGIMRIPAVDDITEDFKQALRKTLKLQFYHRMCQSSKPGVDQEDNAWDALTQDIIDLIMDYQPTPANDTPEPPEGFSDWFNQTFMPACTSLGHTSTSFCKAFGMSPVEYFHFCEKHEKEGVVSYSSVYKGVNCVGVSGLDKFYYGYEGIYLPCYRDNKNIYHPATKQPSA